jgi:hypothetical protein
MNNTPRTDAAEVTMLRLDGDADVVVAAFFARQLERELIAAQSATAALPVEEKAIGHALNTLDIIANWGDEENEWDAVVKYRSVRDRAATLVAILRSDRAQQLPGAEIFDRAARYEYIRTLNPREFAALYDEALHGDRFDDLVDRYRDAGGQHG